MYRFLIGMLGICGLVVGSGSYRDSIYTWQHERDTKLREPDSWLTLVDLLWLRPGENTIGSAAGNDLVLPVQLTPAHLGVVALEGNEVTYRPVHGPAQVLSTDEEHPNAVHVGTLSFYAIQRSGRFGIRAKDSESPVRRNFRGLEYFPVNARLHLRAKFLPDAKQIPILNIIGQTEMQESPGVVEFAFGGQTYRLRPILEDKTLFFLFKDRTNQTETYQAGRMLNTPLPADGTVDLDFNRSYNPPCTFTPYATCPLPPKENTLPFAVEAGEKRYGNGHVELTAMR